MFCIKICSKIVWQTLMNMQILKLRETSFMSCFDMFIYRASVRLQQCRKDCPENQYLCYTVFNDEVHVPKQTERKIFRYYSGYAWGLPVLVVGFSMAIDSMPTIPSSYLKPNFGDNKCWFSSKWHNFVWINKTLKPKNCLFRKFYALYFFNNFSSYSVQ